MYVDKIKTDRTIIIRVRISPKTLDKWGLLVGAKRDKEVMDDIIYRMCERELRAYSARARLKAREIEIKQVRKRHD